MCKKRSWWWGGEGGVGGGGRDKVVGGRGGSGFGVGEKEREGGRRQREEGCVRKSGGRWLRTSPLVARRGCWGKKGKETKKRVCAACVVCGKGWKKEIMPITWFDIGKVEWLRRLGEKGGGVCACGGQVGGCWWEKGEKKTEMVLYMLGRKPMVRALEREW